MICFLCFNEFSNCTPLVTSCSPLHLLNSRAFGLGFLRISAPEMVLKTRYFLLSLYSFSFDHQKLIDSQSYINSPTGFVCGVILVIWNTNFPIFLLKYLWFLIPRLSFGKMNIIFGFLSLKPLRKGTTFRILVKLKIDLFYPRLQFSVSLLATPAIILKNKHFL